MKRFKGILGAFAWRKNSRAKQRAAEEAMVKDFERNWTVKNVSIDITTADSDEVETVKGQVFVRKTAETPTK